MLFKLLHKICKYACPIFPHFLLRKALLSRIYRFSSWKRISAVGSGWILEDCQLLLLLIERRCRGSGRTRKEQASAERGCGREEPGGRDLEEQLLGVGTGRAGRGAGASAKEEEALGARIAEAVGPGVRSRGIWEIPAPPRGNSDKARSCSRYSVHPGPLKEVGVGPWRASESHRSRITELGDEEGRSVKQSPSRTSNICGDRAVCQLPPKCGGRT